MRRLWRNAQVEHIGAHFGTGRAKRPIISRLPGTRVESEAYFDV